MIDLVLDAFGSQITQRALVGGLLTATTTALIGTWVVVRGLRQRLSGDVAHHLANLGARQPGQVQRRDMTLARDFVEALSFLLPTRYFDVLRDISGMLI